MILRGLNTKTVWPNLNKSLFGGSVALILVLCGIFHADPKAISTSVKQRIKTFAACQKVLKICKFATYFTRRLQRHLLTQYNFLYIWDVSISINFSNNEIGYEQTATIIVIILNMKESQLRSLCNLPLIVVQFTVHTGLFFGKFSPNPFFLATSRKELMSDFESTFMKCFLSKK